MEKKKFMIEKPRLQSGALKGGELFVLSVNIMRQEPINNNALILLKEYINHDFNIIPLKEQRKTPAIKQWKPLLKQPLPGIELKKIYSENPKLNIGLLTGPSSGGLIVIDIDNSPPEELAFLIAQNPTTTIRTSRGRHYYYHTERKLPNLNYDWGELRANGVYVVAPPSVHPDGTHYNFLDGYGLDQISEIPDTIVDYLIVTARKKDKKDSVVRLNNKPKESVVRIELNIQSCYTLEDSLKDFEIAKKVMRLCGREVGKLGEAFRCPIHDDERPSVALWRGKNGKIVLHEFHNGDHFLTLADVYASFVCGKSIKLKRGELITWWLRCLEEIGEIKPPLIKAKKLPLDAPKSVKKVYSGFIRLSRLRMIYDPNQRSTPFSWSFALNWCGIGSMSTIQKAMKYLLSNGYIKMVEKGHKIGEGTKAALFILS